MKYTQFKGKYYIVEKDKSGTILLIPADGLERVKAWARLVILEANEQSALSNVRFVFDGNTIICLDDNYHSSGRSWGMATCRHGKIFSDEFCEEIGKAISYYRMLGESIPEFVFDEDAED